MITASGTGILDSIAIGRIRYCGTREYAAEGLAAGEPAMELDRFEKARRAVQHQQETLYQQAVLTAGEQYAEIFRLYSEILNEESLLRRMRQLILEEQLSAAKAVRQCLEEVEQRFRTMQDPYLRERSADVADIKHALLQSLSEDAPGEESGEDGNEMQILAAEDITPSEAIRLDRRSTAGIVMQKGSTLSHTAILARSMNLPALVHCEELSEDWDGRLAVLDERSGELYVDPSAEFLAYMQGEQEKRRIRREELRKLRTSASVTLDGTRVAVCANIAVPGDVKAAMENGAEAIGLFRSEFLYLNADREPTEEEQLQAYRGVLEASAPKRVVIRTFDIGADKTASYLNLPQEENPALGCRAIRLGLERKDMVKRQIRALLRASVYGQLEIVLPMVTAVWEVREIKRLFALCREELGAKGVPMAGNIPLGILIETPAAALCAEELAAEADFFSIGTNDLAQYTCAADRQNPGVERFFNQVHPAVMRQIQMSVQAARARGIRTGVCGEMAGNPQVTETLLRMGVDELSVNPAMILPLRSRIREMRLR